MTKKKISKKKVQNCFSLCQSDCLIDVESGSNYITCKGISIYLYLNYLK